MRNRVRLLVAACFYYMGAVHLALWWQQRFRRRLIILNYHRASGENLRRQFVFLRAHYRVMHAEAALEEFFQQGKEARGYPGGPLPLVLTFDDGYRDNYTYAFALARELHMPITIYLIPGYIGNRGHFWWQEGSRLVQQAGVEKVSVDGHIFDLREPEERAHLVKMIDNRARYARSVAEREIFLERIRQELAVAPDAPEEEGSQPLTWEEVREMGASEWVSFGAHTMHHPLLECLEDPVELRYEVTRCRQVLEEHLGHPVRSFVYPIGKLEHFGAQGLQAVQSAGYDWAITTVEETITLQANPYLLGRVPGDLDQHWLLQAAELAGLLGIFSRLRKKL
jgi:peptidoglycan/xylan/chitin deacetylase (PgdA/CDA1 family)